MFWNFYENHRCTNLDEVTYPTEYVYGGLRGAALSLIGGQPVGKDVKTLGKIHTLHEIIFF